MSWSHHNAAQGGGGNYYGGEGVRPGPRHVLLEVPPGFKPGSDLFFISPGGGCSVVVPEGLQEGDSFQAALPHVEQKIEILNAYFGRDPWDVLSDGTLGTYNRSEDFQRAARSVTEHAASALSIEDQIEDIENLGEKVDKCLAHLLDQQSEGKKHFVDAQEAQLAMCRDRSVSTAVATPLEPLGVKMERNIRSVPFVGPPTSFHNGIYITGGILGLGIDWYNAVDGRTLESLGCCCFLPLIPTYQVWTTNDGIKYTSEENICKSMEDEIKNMGKCFCRGEAYSCKVC